MGRAGRARAEHGQRHNEGRRAQYRRRRICAAESRGVERADGHGDYRWRAERERGAAEEPGYVCQPAPGEESAWSEIAFRRRGCGACAGEHRGSLFGTGARSGPWRGGKLEDYHGEGFNEDRTVCVRIREEARAEENSRDTQGQHHEAWRWLVPTVGARGRGGI